MSNAFFWASTPVRWAILGVTGAISCGLAVWLSQQGQPLQNSVAVKGIVTYEFAGNAVTAGKILDSWKDQREVVRWQLLVDFAFLIVYPIAFSVACALMSGSASNPFAQLGAILSWAILAAILLDAAENVCLLVMLNAGPSDWLAKVAAIAAGFKFALLFASGGYLVLAGPVSLWRR